MKEFLIFPLMPLLLDACSKELESKAFKGASVKLCFEVILFLMQILFPDVDSDPGLCQVKSAYFWSRCKLLPNHSWLIVPSVPWYSSNSTWTHLKFHSSVIRNIQLTPPQPCSFYEIYSNLTLTSFRSKKYVTVASLRKFRMNWKHFHIRKFQFTYENGTFTQMTY